MSTDNDATPSGEDENREIPPFVDQNADYVLCHFCGLEWKPHEVEGFDLSAEDEYYPKMKPVCPEIDGRGCR